MIAQYTTTTTTSSSVNLAALLPFLFLYVAVIALMVTAWVKIISKAGYSGWWVLVGLIPCVGIVMFFVFAFSRWPVLDQRTPPASYPGYGAPPMGYVPPMAPNPQYPNVSPPPPPPQDWPPNPNR